MTQVKTQTVLSINEKFTLRFIESVRDYEQSYQALKGLLKYKVTIEDLTKENCGDYPLREGVNEVLFLIEGVTIADAFLIKSMLNKIG